jgi:hypothetical protein
MVTKLSKIWVWDRGSGIQDPGSEVRDPGSEVRDPGSEVRDPEKTYSGSRILDPGVKKAPDPGSGSGTLLFSMQQFFYVKIFKLSA